MMKRYPNLDIPDIPIFQYDIFNLSSFCKIGTVDEIKCDCLLEHLSFKEEKKFWYEVKEVL